MWGARPPCEMVERNLTGFDLSPFVHLLQGFPTCGTRTTSGTRRSSRWYASNFHFFTKTWIHRFPLYVSGFVTTVNK